MRRLLLLTALLTAAAAPPAAAQEQTQICHATGSPQNPYVPMTLDNAGVLEHVNHEEDLVPAPADGCPAAPVVLPDDTPTPTATPEYVVPTPTPTPNPTATPRPPRDRDRDDDAGGVKGGGGGGGGGTGAGQPTLSGAPPAGVQAQTTSADTQDLPMTGAEMWLIAAFGVGFLLSGAGIRLLTPAAGRPPGPSGR